MPDPIDAGDAYESDGGKEDGRMLISGCSTCGGPVDQAGRSTALGDATPDPLLRQCREALVEFAGGVGRGCCGCHRIPPDKDPDGGRCDALDKAREALAALRLRLGEEES